MTLIQIYLGLGALLSTAYAAYKLYDGGLKPGDFVHAPIETGLVWLVVTVFWPFVMLAWWLEHNER